MLEKAVQVQGTSSPSELLAVSGWKHIISVMLFNSHSNPVGGYYHHWGDYPHSAYDEIEARCC